MHSSLNIIWVIKLRIMRWAGHVARRGRGEVYTGCGSGNLGERDHLENLSVDGRIKIYLQETGWGLRLD